MVSVVVVTCNGHCRVHMCDQTQGTMHQVVCSDFDYLTT